jgi:hypothetical protein
MRKCSKCKVDKNISMFYKNKSRPDGLQHECKDCTKIRNMSYRAVAYRSSDLYKASKAKGQVKYNIKNPYRNKAHSAVFSALRNGQLKRPPFCAVCWTSCIPEAHHDDYNYPLEVRWLCRSCHKEWHSNNKAIQHVDSKK